ncbi:MAG: beta-N-acetylhexosaminidase [Kordiimonadaceae bacterium]|nr:beta-N-acetylhexosaminidase [Kordiimonadaceae bacterium]MBT6031352.1 beta-N-acetylhexosaminidase [Kordiimonadaceae bacterium]
MSANEKALFNELKPFGFILFQRNCQSPEQVKNLTDEMRESVGNEKIPILIDQEGGRVARLRPPGWVNYPSAGVYSKLYDADPNLAITAVQVHASLMASKLVEIGVNVDCYPVADLVYEGMSEVVGNRSFGETPVKVTALARAASEGMLSCGVTPVMKHLPGHGRAKVDSHLELPIVDTSLEDLIQTDFAPFKSLNDLPCAMTAHVIYSQIDPEHCATISSKIIKEIIRDEIGFEGVLFSDDLGMKALSHSPVQNALDALNAGCDLASHCNGSFEERRQALEATEHLKIDGQNRLWDYFKARSNLKEIDHDQLYNWLKDVIKYYE